MNLKAHTKASFAAAAVAAAMLSTPQAALATPVNYYGAIFDLSIADIGFPGAVYEVTYTADFTNFTNGGVQPYIDSIAWKHAGENVSWVSLISDPGAGWAASADSTVNAGGCSSTGGTTWACAEDGSSPYVPTSGLLTWVFWATFDSSLSSLSTTGDSIKARFVNGSGDKQGALLSCTLDDNTSDNCSITTTRVPEPTSMSLLGLGLLAAGVALRKKKTI